MEKIKFGIGFVAGRDNVCNIINTYYKSMIEQLGQEVNLTIFILYDTNYMKTPKENFYNINKEVYEENINIKYITEEEINIQKENLQKQYNFTKEEADLFLGYGYARARNTIMYCAFKNKIDYLLFWDDDEYPVACIKENEKIEWRKQNNLLEHMKYIKDADITTGYHCGYISPIPHIDIDKSISEEDLKNYIDAVSNEAVFWDKIKNTIKENGITYAQKDILDEEKVIKLDKVGIEQWLPGTTICINLRRIEKIPAFYNPPNARGEDTFFSCMVKDAKIYKIPTYHFHDGFLKYTGIMKNNYPTYLRKIRIEDAQIEKRFLNASLGWIKYKPLMMYILHKRNYKNIMKEAYQKLEECIPKMNTLFPHNDVSCLLKELKLYDENVETHYQEFIRTNKIWEKIKESEKNNV